MDKTHYFCPSVLQNSSVVICFKKTSLLSPPLLLHHIFYVSTIHHGINRTQDNNTNVLWTGWWEYWRSGRGFRVGEVLKCGRGFTLNVNFPGGKNLCEKEWREGEVNVHNAAMNQNPKPKLVLLLPCCCYITFFTSTSNINYSVFFMLDDIFIPFLKTRSYDRSAHTFGSTHRFLEVPHKGVLNKWFVGIFFTLIWGPPTVTI